jgi:TraT complement resistance protein
MKTCVLSVVLVVLGAVGCSPRIYDVKLDKSLFLDTQAGQSVYLKVTNTSSLQNYTVADDIRTALTAKGFKLTTDRDAADVVLRANIRYTGLIEEGIKGGKIAAGTALGGTIGGLGSAVGGASRSGSAATALGGMLVGAGLGYWMEKSDTKNTFVTVVDIQVKETKINRIKIASIYARIREGSLTPEAAAQRVKADIANQIAGQF